MTWRGRALIALVLTCFALFSAAVLFNSSGYKLYQADLQDNRRDCEAERKAEQGKHSKECQSLLYRTLDDPVALLTGALFVATVGLFVVTYGLFAAAMRQGRDTERLFVQDKRPWVQLSVTTTGPPTFKDGAIIVEFVLNIKNIGHSPAYQVTRSWLFVHVGMDGTKEYFDKTRNEVNGRMSYMGDTLLPGEEISHECSLDIMPATIEESRNKPSLCTGTVAVCFKYRSNLTGSMHETTRVFMLNIDGGCPLYLVEQLHSSLNKGISLSRLSVFDVTT